MKRYHQNDFHEPEPASEIHETVNIIEHEKKVTGLEAKNIGLGIENKHLQAEIIKLNAAQKDFVERNAGLVETLYNQEREIGALKVDLENKENELKTGLKNVAKRIENQKKVYEENLKELREFKANKLKEEKQEKKRAKKKVRKAIKTKLKALNNNEPPAAEAAILCSLFKSDGEASSDPKDNKKVTSKVIARKDHADSKVDDRNEEVNIGGNKFSRTGDSPKWVKSRRRRKKERKKKKVGENNGQVRFVRHHVWRTQARLDQKICTRRVSMFECTVMSSSYLDNQTSKQSQLCAQTCLPAI